MQIKLLSADLFWRMRMVILIGFLQAGVAVILAMSVKNLLNESDPTVKLTNPELSLLMVFGAALLASVLKWRERILSESVGQSFTHNVRISLFDHLSRLSYLEFHRQRKGPLLLRFMNDLTALRQWITLGLSRLLVGLCMIAIGLPALWHINYQLGLMISVVLISTTILIFMQGSGLNQTVRHARKKRSVLASRVTEKLMMVDVIQRMTARQIERRNVSKVSKSLVKAMNARADRVGRLRGLTLLAGNLCIVLLAAYPIIFRGQTTLSTGEILAGLTLVSFMTPALFDFGRVFEYWHGAKLAAEKVEKVFEKGPLIHAPKRGTRKRVTSSRIRISDLNFGSVFDGLNMDIRTGEKVLITGKNGTGKSTLLRLIMRLDEPDSGEIRLGPMPISRIGLGNLRRAVTLITNEDLLIKGTISENLKYPHTEKLSANDREQISILRLGLDDKASPFYLKNRVVEFGRNLSQGEKAMLLIARAMLRRPKILLLDEICVHLDRVNKKRVFNLIAEFPGTVIFISHAPQKDLKFDQHFEIRRGKLRNVKKSAQRVVPITTKTPRLQEAS